MNARVRESSAGGDPGRARGTQQQEVPVPDDRELERLWQQHAPGLLLFAYVELGGDEEAAVAVVRAAFAALPAAWAAERHEPGMVPKTCVWRLLVRSLRDRPGPAGIVSDVPLVRDLAALPAVQRWVRLLHEDPQFHDAARILDLTEDEVRAALAATAPPPHARRAPALAAAALLGAAVAALAASAAVGAATTDPHPPAPLPGPAPEPP